MLTLRPHPLAFRTVTFLVWAMVAASVVYWGLKLSSGPSAMAGALVAGRSSLPVDPLAVSRSLGGGRAEAPAVQAAPTSSRFVLTGMFAGLSKQGIALIAVDGKPAKPVRVGAKVDEGLVLQSVQPRRASLGERVDSPALFVLELPVSPVSGK